MCDRCSIFPRGMMIFPLCTVWLFCKDFGGMGYGFMPILWNPVHFSGPLFFTFLVTHICFFFFNQAIIIVCVLSMRKQPYISRELWNWILGILGPGHWWDMSTWRWRTHLLLFRLIGELLVGGWGGADCCDVKSLYWVCKSLTLILPSYPSLRHAIEVNKRDYRAWYGLGQTYEILKMPFYCLYYYRRAHQLR